MLEKIINVNQINLQIRDYEQEADAIIFLHFGGANLMMWQRIIPVFQDRYRLILLDFRGHGKSDRPENGYHIDQLASDIVGVMHHLNLEQAHIVGSSTGAEVGLSLAANHPEKVISLVCDGALYSEYGPFGMWNGSEMEFQAYVASQLKEMQDTPVDSYPTLDALIEARRSVLSEFGCWNEHVEEMERYGAVQIGPGEYRRGMGKEALANYMQAYFLCRFEDYYRRVICPLLVLTGKELDDEREKRATKGLVELAEQGEIVEVSGWIHPYGWLLDPGSASKVVLKFIDKSAQ